MQVRAVYPVLAHCKACSTVELGRQHTIASLRGQLSCVGLQLDLVQVMIQHVHLRDAVPELILPHAAHAGHCRK